MSELRRLARRAIEPLFITALALGVAGLAYGEQPSPPLLDKNSKRVWIDDGYIEFLMSPPAYPPRQYREKRQLH